MPLLEVKDLKMEYWRGPQLGPVSFSIQPGEAFALVGESGSGKSTIAHELLDVLRFKGGKRSGGTVTMLCRPEEVAYIPQDPAAALDPLFTVGNFIRELGYSMETVRTVMAKVGLPLEHFNLRRYPHELSGGMLQRFLIGMALACAPRLIIADEPTSSLDVIHQARIVELFHKVRGEGIALLYITHHVPLAMDLCPRMAVLCQGKIVETGDSRQVYQNPRHEFTRRLFQTVPVMEVS